MNVSAIILRQIALNFVNAKLEKLSHREREIVNYLHGLDAVRIEKGLVKI